MASATEAELRERVSALARLDATWARFHVVADQDEALREDVQRVRTHPLVPDTVPVGGFLYDVDSGLLERRVRRAGRGRALRTNDPPSSPS